MDDIARKDTQAIELGDLLGSIARHKLIIASMTMLVVAMAVAYIKATDKLYYAHSVILLEDQDKNLEMEKLTELRDIDEPYISSEIQLLKSRELIRKTLEAIGAFENPSLLIPNIEEKKKLSNETIISFVLKRLKVKQILKSRTIEVGYKSYNKEITAKLVNKLVELYIENKLISEKADLSSTGKWLKNRVKQLSENVKKIETQIVEYRKSSNFIDSDGRSLIENEIMQLSEKLIDAKVALVEAKVKWDEINGENPAKSAPEIIKSPVIQKLLELQAKTKDKVFELNKEYGENHPEMIAANSRLQSITNKIDLEIENIAKSLEREYKIAQANLEEIKAQLDELKAKYNEISKYRVKLSLLEREAQDRKKLLEKLNIRWKEIQIQANSQLQSPNAKIISKAVTPVSPQGPAPTIIILIAAIGGVSIGIVLAVSLDYMQTNIYNGKQLQRYTNLPNIALIPKLRGSAGSLIANSVKQLYKAPLSDYSESLRSLTAYLKQSIKKDPSRKIFNFTSISKGDGKAALVAAAGCQMSLEGLKILVIDCDLRNPSLGRAFGLQEKKGLSNLLSGDGKIQDVIYTDKDSAIDIIGIGTLQDINIIKKGAKAWKQILAQASKEYDIIMLNGPPAINISDMSILAEDSQNIICVRWKKTLLKQIIYSQSILKSLNFDLLGTVITLVSPKKIRKINRA